MENKFDETGSEYGNTLIITAKSRSFSLVGKEQIKAEVRWGHPKQAKELVLQLMELVNSKEEYEELVQNLAELETFAEAVERRLCIEKLVR